MVLRACSVVLVGCLLSAGVEAGEWAGNVSVEYRGFFEQPPDPQQYRSAGSLSAQPEYRHAWDNGRESVKFVPFVRWDSADDERTHADLRELYWLKAAESYEWRVGVRKVFWGVTESQHLVDIINQTDLIENIDGEDKLGQPMVNLTLIRRWGTIDLFMLPYFRERSFPGAEGRLRSTPRVDSDQPVYESSREEKHIDWAARWSHHIDVWDIGLSHFYGTSREPRLVPGLDVGGQPVLIPYYDLIHQTGLDVQATYGSWLWKLEAIRRKSEFGRHAAATAGFEYTFYGVLGTAADVGVVLEYLYDDRGSAATTPFQNDVMGGLRLAFNDVQSSEALIGVIVDRDSQARFYSIEASRRLGAHWKLSLEARLFSRQTPADLLYALRVDDYAQVELAYYF